MPDAARGTRNRLHPWSLMSSALTIKSQCQKCGSRLDVSSELIGTLHHCKVCKANFVIPATAIMSGRVVGDYWMQKRLGGSLRSDVFLAKRLSSNERVAVKVLNPFLDVSLAQLQEYIRIFRSEYFQNHPTIIGYLEAGEVDQHRFLVAEYFPVEDLKALLLRVGPLPEGKLLALAQQAAMALEFAWSSSQIAHGTLKPANLMLLGANDLKIPEFGFYNLLVRTGNQRHENDVEDVAYMSPEQIDNQPADFRSDMYGFGAALYHLATGAKPLAPTRANALLGESDSLSVPPMPPAHQVNVKLSREFSEFLSRLLNLQPENRPESWSRVAEQALHLSTQVAVGTETQSFAVPAVRVEREPESPKPQQRRNRSRRKRKAGDGHRLVPVTSLPANTSTGAPKWLLPFLVIALIALVMIFGAVALSRPRDPEKTKREQADLEAARRRQERLNRLRKQYEDAMRFAAENPDDLQGAIDRFTDVRTEGVGTEYQKLAHERILALRKKLRQRQPQGRR